MFEGLLLQWQQVYHLAFSSIFTTTPEVSTKLFLLNKLSLREVMAKLQKS